ncbi:hypothetical protein [Mesorhizobium sp. M0058]|uniref:hypothetical protein n=1 Tax=Mesorhizobium sp. M0058 TaxID=2956865 RepID=UPI0033358E5A
MRKSATNAACLGATTKSIRVCMEHMEECRACGTAVRIDLLDHPVFGFKAGCASLVLAHHETETKTDG